MVTPKRTQVRFTRTEISPNQFKTRVSLERAAHTPLKNRGIFHKLIDAQSRFVGDVPTVKHTLDQIQPETTKGKIALNIAKGGEAVTRHTLKFGVNTALRAENAALGTAQNLKHTISNRTTIKLQNNLSQMSEYNDFVKAGVKSGVIVYRLVKEPMRFKNATRQYFSSRDHFKDTKKSYKYQKKKNKKLRLEQRRVFKEQKIRYSNNRTSYTNSDKSNLRRNLIKARKEIYKSYKNDYKDIKHKIKKANKSNLKELRKDKAISNLSRKQIIRQPIKDSVLRFSSRSIYKLSAEDPDNDFAKATSKVVQFAQTVKKSPSQKFKKAQSKLSKQHDKTSKAKGKLKKQQAKLSNKRYSNTKSQQHHKRRHKKSHKKSNIGNAIADKFSVKFMRSMLIIAVIVLAIALVVQSCTSIMSNSGFITEAYTASDADIANAEKYYTKLAWDFNQKVLKVGSNTTWKNALKSFGVDTKNYEDVPDQYIFGKSVKFPYDSIYEYDPYILNAFLTAYYYNFKNDDIQYWHYSSDVEKLLKQLFELQYEFQSYYDNTSHWEEKSSYVFEGGGGASSGTYYKIDGDNAFKSKIKAISIPQSIWNFCDDEGYIHYDFNTLEILNAKKKNERTGWFFQDQRYIVIDPSGNRSNPFFYKNYNGDFAWMLSGHEKVRDYYGWSDTEQAWWIVPFNDSLMWNSSAYYHKCFVSFYQRNEWVTDCRLYYTVRQKRTFESAVKYLLSKLPNSTERFSYYQTLAYGDKDTNAVYGLHQCIESPIVSGFDKLLRNNRYYNKFGWDMQTWNETHCSATLHEGIDIDLAPNCTVFAMVDGKITSKDSNSLVIETTSKVKMWDKKRHMRITYFNVAPSNSLKSGDTVKAGKVIGLSTGQQKCVNVHNSNANKYFLHVKVEVYDHKWYAVDPQLLINFKEE